MPLLLQVVILHLDLSQPVLFCLRKFAKKASPELFKVRLQIVKLLGIKADSYKLTEHDMTDTEPETLTCRLARTAAIKVVGLGGVT